MDAFNVTPAIALPTQYGAPGVPLPSGQVVQAVVLALLENNVARLQLPQAVIDIRANVPLIPGAHLTLAVHGSGPHAKLVILANDMPASGRGEPGGRPIGEAVVLGRVQPTQVRAALPVAEAPSVSPARPDPVQQALGETLRVAASRQGGLAPLFANLEALLRSGARLPEPVKAAAAQLLAARVPLDTMLTAGDLKQALARSGLFLEARLAAAPASTPGQASPGHAPAGQAPPAGSAPVPTDLKAALLVLRQVLQTWSQAAQPPSPGPGGPAAAPSLAGGPNIAPELAAQNAKAIGLVLAGLADAHAEPAAPRPLPAGGPPPAPAGAAPAALPPPYRGAPTAAQAPAPPSLAPDLPPHETAERLIAQTDAALSRQTLLQAASLPDRADDGVRSDPAAHRLAFEVPCATPQGTAVAQFEISRDGHRGEAGQGPVWRARFSVDVEPIGPVHALVTMVGARTSVTLWAEREASAARLAEGTAALAQSLQQAELEPGEILCRVGAPARPRPAAGQFLDRAS
ncbi:MAG: flagellar hook-length control protein FliK [Xanthobacteraceae bacterium]|nr:flagellar hook-length control protein FliK [Xanthobacteraceae bacterium]